MLEMVLQIAKEFKAPVSFVVFLFMMVTVAWLTKDHVSINDLHLLSSRLESVQNQLSGVESTLRYDHADSELHRVEGDLFGLQQHLSEEKAKGHEVDRLYYERINDLTSRHDELIRQINHMDR